ncbi:MAG: HD domain-containing phosphohydrolase [Thermodesulfobacteriota bacterium]
MRSRVKVNLGNVLLSLSDAMELASPEISQHQQRTAFTVWQMGKAAGLPVKAVEDVFVAALLHDVGALSVEEKESLHGSPFSQTEESKTQRHCILGQALLESLPWLKPAGDIVRYHHTYLKEWGDLADTPVVLTSQMLLLADHLERRIRRDQYILHQNRELTEFLVSMRGERISSAVVDCFLQASGREEFWLDLTSGRLFSILLHEGPYRTFEADILNLTSLSGIFRSIIDFRSRFTATHSAGVAACAALMARYFGLTETEARLMQIAGDLHDLGKLGIPNAVLEKRGQLDGREFSIIKSHTYFTYELLNTIGGLEQITEWAAFHHEKLDGSGYPFHCTGNELNTGARIMAVADLFTAIAEDRPYRKGMSEAQIRKVVLEFSARKTLDPGIIDLLMDHYEEINAAVKDVQTKAMDFYNQQITSHGLT